MNYFFAQKLNSLPLKKACKIATYAIIAVLIITCIVVPFAIMRVSDSAVAKAEEPTSSPYHVVTFACDQISTKINVVKGNTVDFSGVQNAVRYNDIQYRIKGWTSSAVVYPWQTGYIKGCVYDLIDTKAFTPTADTTLNAVLEEDNSVSIGGIINDKDMSLMDRITNYLKTTEVGLTVAKYLKLFKWGMITFLGLLALLVISYMLSISVNFFRK